MPAVTERVACPDGWEPVVDTVCGEPAMYVEVFNDPTRFMSQIRKMWPDGKVFEVGEYAHCGSCGRLASYYRGISRDEHGVRRLW